MSEPAYILPEKDSELEALLDVEIKPAPRRSPCVGEIVDARVRAVSDDTLTLITDEGLNLYVPTEDARPVGSKDVPGVGSVHPVLLEIEEEPGVWIGSIHRAQSIRTFEEILIAANEDEPIDATITVALRNGFAATYEGLRCFIPARESGIRRDEAFHHIGKTYTFDIKDFDRKTCQLILTRKERASAQRRKARQAAMAALSVGQIVEGTVRNILDFGAFVDVGGIDGLLHVSEASLQHVEHPAELFAPGDTVRVKIASLDPEKLKVGLSRKDILHEVYRSALETLTVDEIYDGVVRSLVDFGAFIEIAPGIEGLCHVSELRWTEHVEHPSEVLEIGESVKVRLLSKDAEAERLSLSIRQVDENPWNALLDEHPPGSAIEGTITRIEDYGLFVEIAPGIEGLCHVSDLSWESRPETPRDHANYELGDSIEVKILDIDINRQRIGLGVKHLTTDPWDEAKDFVREGATFTARVTRFGNDAAYLSVAPGLEGRMHISEVSTERVDSIRAELHIGQEVEVMTVRADRARRGLDLSIKAIEEKRLAEQPRAFNEGEARSSLADALAAQGFSRTTEVTQQATKSESAQPGATTVAPSETGRFDSDSDLIEGFQAQVAGLKQKSDGADASREAQATTAAGDDHETDASDVAEATTAAGDDHETDATRATDSPDKAR